MKKDLHDLLFTVWIDGSTAMIIRDEPEGTHHYEIMHNEDAGRERFKGETTDKTGNLGSVEDHQPTHQNRENQILLKWVKAVAHKFRYAHTVHILGSGEVRHLLQNEIESNKELQNIVITNSAYRKVTREEFETIAKENMVY
jgi:hypothetical protein